MGVFSLVVNECPLTIVIPTKNISHLMVHAKQIEEKNLRQVGREQSRTRVEDNNSFKSRLEVQGKPKFKKRYYNQGSANTSYTNK